MKNDLETFYIQDSSRIERIIFNPESKSIRILFKGNKEYLYKSISEFDFRMFREDVTNGESVGKSFEKRIRNKYAGTKL